ncbi:hypothetical protein F503_02384 [Ophiostoma piceae UAMH 11346]|uniref:Uncharacterized protein n=1 Tax=Ophiostoma piceae (strain UAMH 11346) TaxID=1262450 RepID=S3C3A7_OPHP1|nr:hypothetical protein F503_02384 [Ophiostoma piceae UAMH 11346]
MMALTMPVTVPLVEPLEADTLLPTRTLPLALLTVITFRRRQWASRDNRLTLTLTATAQLAWPPSTASPTSSSNIFNTETVPAARVAQLVRSGRLWIGTDGRSVQLGVKATLGGKSCIRDEQLKKLKELIADWPWSELGLVDDRSRGEETDLVFCHPPSPDGLYTPHGIPHARLVRVDCQLGFYYCPDGFILHAPPVARLPEQKPTGKSPPSKQKARHPLEAKGKKKKKPKKPPKPRPRAIKPARTLADPDCLFNEVDGFWERTCATVEAALATFIGTKGRQVGARPLDQWSLPSGVPSLLDIAPAVWSYHLFRSPSLRRKAEALTRLPATADQPSSQEGLATKIEEILLKGTLFEPQRLKRLVGGSRRARQTMLLQVPHLPSPEPTTASSSQDPRELTGTDLECEIQKGADEGLFYDVDVDNFEHAFDLSQEGESDAGEAVDWDDIEAWAEQPDSWPEENDDGDAFHEVDSSWSPLGPEDDSDGRHGNEMQREADWQDVEDGQLDAALSASGNSQQEPRSPWCEDEQYMDVDEMGLFHMGAEDGYEADEGIGMWQWQNEHEMIEHIL